MVLICKTLSPFIHRYFMPKLIEIGAVILERKILKLCECTFAISELSPLKKGVALPLTKLKTQSFKDAVCQVWLKSSQNVLEFFFQTLSIYLHSFVVIFLLFVCWLVLSFSSHSRNVYSFGDVTIVGEDLQMLNYARHSCPLSSVLYLL